MTALKIIRSHADVVYYFKELSFYNKHIEKLKIKCLKNIDLFFELPFYEKLNILKTIMWVEDMQQVTKLK